MAVFVFLNPQRRMEIQKFASFLDSTIVDNPKITTYSNYLGAPYEHSVKDILAKQINNPVLWQKSVEDMIRRGVDTFIEIGPGTTLTSIIRKIDKNQRVYPAGNLDAIRKIQEEVSC